MTSTAHEPPAGARVHGERRAATSKVSVVAPVYNEVSGIAEFCQRVLASIEEQVGEVELILVDDGSTDGSHDVMRQLARADARIRILSFSRNFGHQPAVTAGLDRATGDCVVVIDSDLQDPPEVILDLLRAWEDGGDVVHAVRAKRQGERRLRNAAIWSFYRVMGRLTTFELTLDSGDFRLYDRRAADVLRAMPERQRFIRGLASWVGFNQTKVQYVREARFAGESKYPLRKLLRLAITGITSFSYVPLQVASFIGMAISAVMALVIPLVIVLRVLGLYGLGGQTTVLLAVLFVGGVQLLFLGILGEYLGLMSDEVKRRPVYVIAYDSSSADGRPMNPFRGHETWPGPFEPG